ncbi:MAG TPA: glutamate--tRNA ligase [Gammaproteobacteria bacterium]|nr:glutamate--tRNA ligase [Gammaproteobacteria bacterium]
MNQPTLKTRFCPSPTGLVHLGNIRTALFNALLAKGQGGIFLLRIEDTDKARSDVQFAEALQEDLRWLGLDWDEGPGCEGAAGPYWQSQRQTIYDRYYQQLEQLKLAYPCFCTEQQLALARKLQRSAGKPPRYAGTCRELTKEAIAEKLAQGLQPTLRFQVPLDQETVFHDLVRGEQRFKNNDIGDFIIRRADGTPPFMYCNAIDDALMGVTHALRGEDHLTNTPRQIMILKALNLPIPQYGHISLIIGSDGAPLSKRHGSRSIQALREQGYLPKAINNYLARLGHYYAAEQLMDMQELAERFSLKSLGAAPARFDANQLLYWQREVVQRLDNLAFWQWAGEAAQQLVPEQTKDLFINSVRTNVTFPADCAHWAQVFYQEDWSYGEEQQTILREAGAKYFAVVEKVLNQQGAKLDDVIAALKTELQVKGKMLFQPLRIALTGEMHGPELLVIFELLGEKRLADRIEKAMRIAQAAAV